MSGRSQGNDVVEFVGEGTAFDPEFVFALEVHPELGGVAEVAAESDRGIGGDAAFAVDDLVDASRRDADGDGHPVLGDSQGIEELVLEHLTGVDGIWFVAGGHIAVSRYPAGPWT